MTLAIVREGDSFELDEDIGSGGSREAVKTCIGLQLENVKFRPHSIEGSHLEAGLFANAFIRFSRAAVRLALHWADGHFGELGHCVDGPVVELVALEAGDAGDEGEVVVFAAASVAVAEPAADIAVRAGLGVSAVEEMVGGEGFGGVGCRWGLDG